MLKIGCTTPENDLICFILVMGIPTTYNGAVGMTFEQGGIGAGREVLMENGSSLTIKDRLTHHAKAVLTAVEVATSESDKLIEGFRIHDRI
jgi:hypothetical protein